MHLICIYINWRESFLKFTSLIENKMASNYSQFSAFLLTRLTMDILEVHTTSIETVLWKYIMDDKIPQRFMGNNAI